MPIDPRLGITATYKEMVEYVSETISLRDDLLARLLKTWLDSQPWWRRWYCRLIGMSRWLVPAASWIGVVRTFNSFTAQARDEVLAIATDAERTRPEFEHVAAEYWLESIARGCCVRFQLDLQTLQALRKVHDLREAPSQFQRLTSPQLFFTVVGGTFGVFAVLVPEEAFEVVGWGGQAYGWFRVAVALAIAVMALFLLFLAGLHRIGRSRVRRRAAEALLDVLTYCEVECAYEPASP
jgi:hypothetical protein